MNETSILNLDIEQKKELALKKLKKRYEDIKGTLAIVTEYSEPVECVAYFKHTGLDWEIARGSGPNETIAITNLLDIILMQK